METPEREPWVNYIEGDVIGKEIVGGFKIYQLVIRVQGSGLLAIVKAKKHEDYLVRFIGCASLPGLSAKVRDAVVKDDPKWKKDKYPPI